MPGVGVVGMSLGDVGDVTAFGSIEIGSIGSVVESDEIEVVSVSLVSTVI